MALRTRSRSRLTIKQFALGTLAWLAIRRRPRGMRVPPTGEPLQALADHLEREGRARRRPCWGERGATGGPTGGSGASGSGGFRRLGTGALPREVLPGTGGLLREGRSERAALLVGTRGTGGGQWGNGGRARAAAAAPDWRPAALGAHTPAVRRVRRQCGDGRWSASRRPSTATSCRTDGQDHHPARLLADRYRLPVPYGGQTLLASDRMDKVAAAGVQGHVVRLPVYPEIDYRTAAVPLAPLAPIRSGRARPPAARRNRRSRPPTTSTKVLKPAVDDATSKNLYAIVDYHGSTTRPPGRPRPTQRRSGPTSAPRFAGASNVLYQPFNEPIDTNVCWSTLKPSCSS